MPAMSILSSTISEPLTWKEICERFVDEWVCLVELERVDPGQFAFRTARVVGHGAYRRDAVEQSRPWWRHYEEIDQHFTGRIERCVTPYWRHFARVDLPQNPIPRFYPCLDPDDEVTPALLPRRRGP